MKQIKYFFYIILMLSTPLLAHNIIILENKTLLDLKIVLWIGDQKAECVVAKAKKKIINVHKTACLHSIKAKAFFDSSYSIKNMKPNGLLPCAGKNIKFFIDKETDKLAMQLKDIISQETEPIEDSTFSGSSDD